jgi:hypothetical protein
MKTTVALLFSLLLLQSCDLLPFWNSDDPLYPTVYRRLGDQQFSSLQNSYVSGNYYVWTSINRFGFSDMGEDLVNEGHEPAVDISVTESEAIKIAKTFLLANSRFTGVDDTSELSFGKIEVMDHYYDGSKGYKLVSLNQFKDSIEVLSAIYMHVRNREVTYCVGNWYPEIYLSSSLNYSELQARLTLQGKEVTHYTIAGVPWTVKITRKDLDNCRGKLYFLPVRSESKIEIRLAWLFNIPAPVYYKIYVDAITGEVIGESPTIIS